MRGGRSHGRRARCSAPPRPIGIVPPYVACEVEFLGAVGGGRSRPGGAGASKCAQCFGAAAGAWRSIAAQAVISQLMHGGVGINIHAPVRGRRSAGSGHDRRVNSGRRPGDRSPPGAAVPAGGAARGAVSRSSPLLPPMSGSSTNYCAGAEAHPNPGTAGPPCGADGPVAEQAGAFRGAAAHCAIPCPR